MLGGIFFFIGPNIPLGQLILNNFPKKEVWEKKGISFFPGEKGFFEDFCLFGNFYWDF